MNLTTARRAQASDMSIRRGAKRAWRGKCSSDPGLIADIIHIVNFKTMREVVLVPLAFPGDLHRCVNRRHGVTPLEHVYSEVCRGDRRWTPRAE